MRQIAVHRTSKENVYASASIPLISKMPKEECSVWLARVLTLREQSKVYADCVLENVFKVCTVKNSLSCVCRLMRRKRFESYLDTVREVFVAPVSLPCPLILRSGSTQVSPT